MPDVPVTVFTDVDPPISKIATTIDGVVALADTIRSCRDKIRPLLDSPYEKTLFLDTDTYLCEPVYDVFALLDRFDLALAQAPDRCQYDLPELPDCFTELNSGVIAYRQNRRTEELFRTWEETFFAMLEQDQLSYRDQHSLRDALYRSEARLYVLPPEYNFRPVCPNFAGRNCAVKIIHGRHADHAKLASRLNRSRDARVFVASPYRRLTSDIGSYDSFGTAAMNYIFERLPAPLQRWLSGLKARFTAGDGSA